MKELRFPLLEKDDIELRIGQMSKDGTKASLLLYQDARCAMKYLDQVVGPYNWQKRYYEVRGLVICSIGIYDEEKQTWLWKDDTGTAGSIEEEKSIISDSTKRAAVAWGLARELYTAPTIWVKVESKYDKFQVASISYNEKREIKTLEIINDKGEIVYSYGLGKKVSQTTQKAPQKANDDLDSIINSEQELISGDDLSFLQAYVGNLGGTEYNQFFTWLENKYGVKKVSDLTKEQGKKIAYYLKNRNR